MKKGILAGIILILAGFIIVKMFMPVKVPVCVIGLKEFNQRLVVMGRITPAAEVVLGSTISGRIFSIKVEEGDKVEKGKVLLMIEDAELRSNLAIAEAAVSQAKAKLEQVSGTEVRVAEETLIERKYQLNNATEKFERSRKLYENQSLSKSEFEAAELALKQAKSQFEIASTREKSISKGGGDFNLMKATLAQAMANVQLFKDKLAGATVTAPFSGVILSKNVEQGGVVQPGSALFKLARTDEIFITTDVEEKNLSFVSETQKAVASAESYPDKKFDAEVYYISDAVDPSRGTLRIKLKIPDPPDYLKTDMTVSVDMDVTTVKDVILVPAAALDETGTPFVLTLENEKVTKRIVKTGARDSFNVLVTDGLKEGDVIILPEDNDFPEIGKKVEPAELTECR
ncbi:MAG TPA: efflux RND transporter periplasmic adaptor subunit [bacterium]|nr:efflux RND transporter periplasmic adaptor subunit [bacterium]